MHIQKTINIQNDKHFIRKDDLVPKLELIEKLANFTAKINVVSCFEILSYLRMIL